jgi:taurine--2-oxoglutarate transaminase
VIDAIVAQAGELEEMAAVFATRPRAEAAARIAQITPGDLNRTFFSTSGTEANEAAFKIVRDVTKRPYVCSRTPSYHGSTMGAMSLSHSSWSVAFGPTVPGVFHVGLCDPYRCPHAPPGGRCENCGEHCAREVEQEILRYGPERVGGLFLEPVTGSSGGVVIPGDGYLETLREICDRYGILLVFDEVMSGFGRTGRWFACEHWGVVPDVMTLAKGLCGGYVPMGATVVREEVAHTWDDRMLLHGHTFSGHTLGCTAVVASIDVYEQDDLIGRSAEMGEYLMERLLELQERHPSIGDVRGLGLFTAIELVKDRTTKEPFVDFGVKREIVRRMLDEFGIYLFAGGTSPTTMMFTPPLTITTDEIDETISALDTCLGVADAQTADAVSINPTGGAA